MTYFTATQALQQMQEGKLQPFTLLQFSLERIQQRELDVRAWQSLAIETAGNRAQLFDQKLTKSQTMVDLPSQGDSRSPSKDIFSTADFADYLGNLHLSRSPFAGRCRRSRPDVRFFPIMNR